MAGLSIRVYRIDGEAGKTQEVSAREWSVGAMPNLPLIDTRWPLCECHRCRDNDFPAPSRR
ncbi:hypothetical protein [Streptomyces longwoodensis]|uniref:hypothetical protein n=1 Tax=Streptomyces longwoodensis TaxID=68231 RepID=UPI0033E25C99